MTAIRSVTGTAFVVAEFRAAENDAAHPLYTDPIVGLFLDETTQRGGRAPSRHGFPSAGKNLSLRTRYFDDRLDEAIAKAAARWSFSAPGSTPGPCARAPGVVFFEIDDAGTLSFKRERLAAGGIVDPAVFIPGDYVAEGVLALLERNGFRRDEPAFFLWEGTACT